MGNELLSCLEVLRPPDKIPLSQWAENNIYLPAGVSATAGRLKLWPNQKGIADAISDPSIERVTLIKSVRTGLTTLLTAAIGSFVVNDPSPIMLVLPTESDCRDAVVSDIDPIFSESPVLRGALSDDSVDSERNTMTSRRFAGGSLKIVASKSPRNLRRHNVRVLLIDEADAMLATAEGNPIKLAEKRTLSFSNRKIVLGSTPTDEQTSNVYKAWQDSDQRVFEVPCSCGTWHEITWADIRWPDGQPEKAFYVCPACGQIYEHKDKHKLVTAGRWRITRPEIKNHAGFRTNALVSLLPNAAWGVLACEFLEAKEDPALLQVFVNTFLGEIWRQTAHAIDRGEIEALAEPFSLQKMPEEVRLLTCGVDVQHDRLEVVVMGHNVKNKWFILEQSVIYGDTISDNAPWCELDQLLKRQFKHPSGRVMSIEATAIDSGDGATTATVYSFCKGKAGRRVYPIKGAAGEARAVIEATKSNDNRLFIIGVDGVKKQLLNRLEAKSAIAFSDTLQSRFYDELTSEELRLHYTRGQPVRQWVRKTGKQAESLDCVVYAVAVRQLVRDDLSARDMSKNVQKKGWTTVKSSFAEL